jgi:EamA domain-containing membrane protein RarD
MPDLSDLPEIDQRTALIAIGAAGVTAILAASKTVRVLALAGAVGYGVYRLRGNGLRNPWTDIVPPRER